MSFTLWFTGLPASGKSTVAKRVENKLISEGFKVENLDGDDLRAHLHPELGFSEEERQINNRRMAYIASLLNKNGIAVIVAAVSPFAKARENAREIIEEEGQFVLIHVDCPVEVCKERDPKGMYKQAERGEIKDFTGVSHPFEVPKDPDIRVDTTDFDVIRSTEKVIRSLMHLKILEPKEEDTGLTKEEEEQIKDRLEELGYL